tara:strand:+ start:804 stop:2459 length:1656 start_codon:yes stop_codon:yes gene_type:complete
MSLISKLTDLAVAGGGQIARAVQIGNREEEQAEAQAEYDQGIQTDIENRQRAAQAEVDESQMASGPQAFAASFFADQPGAAPVSVKEQLIRDASAFRGATQTRGAPIVAAGGMAPEDIQRLVAGQRPGTPTQPPAFNVAPTQLPGFDVSTGRAIPPEAMPRMTGLIEPPGAPTAAMTREDVLRAAQGDGGMEWYEGNTLYDEALARASQAAGPMPPDDDPYYYTAAGDPTSTSPYEPMPMQLTRPAGFEEARQAAQQRDFRQEAIEAAGPAPERKLFRIADILAAAPSARTEEQRAMLLQAAVDSPDIQAANLTDWAKGAYRDRAMQAVMKLFPEEEEALSEYELLRMQSMRESIETSDLRQQTLQAALDEDAAKAEKRANAVRRTDPRLAKKEALFAFYTANWPRKESGEMTEADWAAGAGELTKMTPSGLGAWTRNNKLSRATRKSVNATAGRLLQMRPKPDPQPKAPKVLKPPIASGLRKDLVQSKAEFREIVDELNALDAGDPGRDALQLELIRANRRRRDIEDQLSIISPKAVSGSGSSPEDPIRL